MEIKTNMKRIGITFTQTNHKNYPAWFRPEDLGTDICLIELSYLFPDAVAMESCDAFVLTGGIDMDPTYYDGPKDYPNRPYEFCPERDEFETNVYAYAKRMKRPILAICRGMQLVNVAEGGNMIQDLGDAGNDIHRKTGDTDKRHGIEIIDGSLLQDITGLTTGEVNSAHHQAIDVTTLPASLRVTASSTEGVPEAIEYADGTAHGFMLGVQWHPERMVDRESNPLSFKIRERFLENVRLKKQI
jgi:putative glutamine amidotransferase